MVKFTKLLTNMWKVKQAFHGLTRRIQTTVEHMRVTNTTTDMVRGEVVALDQGIGARQAIRSDASAEITVEWVGVMAEDTAADATGIARINGYAYVLFDAALTPAVGDPVYVSETAGRATNVAPAGPAYVLRIGTIDNITPYAGSVACWIFLQHCCTPTQVVR